MDYSICKGCFFSEDCLTPCESCNKYVVDQACCIEDEILLKRGGNLQQLNVPYPVRMVGARACWFLDKLSAVTLAPSVWKICEEAFKYCDNLSSVNLARVRSIGKGAFEDCPSLRRINLPSSVESIEEVAFANSGLEEISIPEGITFLYVSTFCGCKNLQKVDLPTTLKVIEDTVFDGCKSLTSIVLPRQLFKIGDYAFANCINLTQIVFKGMVEDWHRVDLGNCWCENTPIKQIVCCDGVVDL